MHTSVALMGPDALTASDSLPDSLPESESEKRIT